MNSGPESRAAWKRAVCSIPLGVNSNFRYWGDDKTLVVKKGEGAYFWDLDGNKYLDYRLAWGPVILGHAHPSVTRSVIQALQAGNLFAMTNEYEITAAEKIRELTGVDMVRLTNTGTEATMHALRIARAYSGRSKILKFEGHYHGFQDYTLFNCQPPVPGCGYRRSPLVVPHGSGIPKELAGLVHVVPFNDEELLEKKIKETWHDLACVICEPVMGNNPGIMPKPGYLEFMKKLCYDHGILLIFDEVKTGFRVAKGGAQELFGVRADLVTYAKAMANGFPIAAIGGRKEIMGEIGYQMIPHGGTYSGNAASSAATIATLEEIANGALEKAHDHGRKLMAGLREILDRKGVPALVQGPPAMFGIVFTKADNVYEYRDWAASDHELYAEVLVKMMEKGVMPDKDSREPWFTSASHNDEDLGLTLSVFEDALCEVL